MKNKIIGLIIILLMACLSFINGQTVKQVPDRSKSLAVKWNWAFTNAGSKEFYIGYSIRRLMGINSHIGSWCSSDSGKVTLYQLLTGKKLDPAFSYHRERSVSQMAKDALSRARGEKNKPEQKVLKEVALLFKFENNTQGQFAFTKLKVNSVDHHVRLDDCPLLWLGQVEKVESVRFLSQLFSKINEDKTRKKLVMAIALHNRTKGVYSFLNNIFEGNYSVDLRKSATFWMGEQDTPEAVQALKKLVLKDPSKKIRKAAVFSLYRIDLVEAEDLLINLARKSGDYDVRKQAIFWLGQKAGKRAAKVLQGVVDQEGDVSIQKKAVFALSQLPNGSGIPNLIRIAKNHHNFKIRKNALFWLGQSGDSRALETIIEILKKDTNQ